MPGRTLTLRLCRNRLKLQSHHHIHIFLTLRFSFYESALISELRAPETPERETMMEKIKWDKLKCYMSFTPYNVAYFEFSWEYKMHYSTPEASRLLQHQNIFANYYKVYAFLQAVLTTLWNTKRAKAHAVTGCSWAGIQRKQQKINLWIKHIWQKLFLQKIRYHASVLHHKYYSFIMFSSFKYCWHQSRGHTSCTFNSASVEKKKAVKRRIVQLL